ncbi:hypothetical protein [uncultured Bifidobacterium sp.]|uniref:hypothetical protein n=1 Tax=uncultured Bifidobacterium sp. TaxID=165187 RepID=UPI002612B3C0|nr:hypothetical protein [uncultured Bifidobacterium sp.]
MALTDDNSDSEADSSSDSSDSGSFDSGSLHAGSSDAGSSDSGSSGAAHLSEEQIQDELDRFQQELESGVPMTANDGGSDSAGTMDVPFGSEDSGGSSDPGGSADPTASFDDELQGLLGNKAKVAVLITRLASARLLSAFCRMSQIDASCMDAAQGAVAILRDLDGDAPEAAAEDITSVVSGMSVILAVNRADKLVATLYIKGKAGKSFAPPLLFASTSSLVEDLMLGISSIEDLRVQGVTLFSTADLDEDAAMGIIRASTRSHRDGNPHRAE